MKYFLDTNICIYFLKGMSEKILLRLKSHSPDDIKIASIVKAELLYGAEKSIKVKENIEKVNDFLFPYEIVSFDDNSAVIYSKIRSQLEKKGNLIGPNDLLIASTVIVNNGILVTNNIGEFKRVKLLKIENWVN
ncbi:type II toxin-antitoxin system VapC family toxin [Candidatus Desantisbacteria bacterium]|nr:type II toxin-antitoxin system VapC family toxin [Candidatus Desantisbacteria bacterium]